MSTYEPKYLNDEDWKDIKYQTVRLAKRMMFSFFTFNILLLSLFTFFFQDWLGYYNTGVFSFVFLTLALGYESSFYEASEGKSIGPESFFKHSKDVFKLSVFKNAILFRNVLVMFLYFMLGFLLDHYVKTTPKEIAFWKESLLSANNLIVVGFFLNITFEKFDFRYLLMRNKNVDYSTANYLYRAALNKNYRLYKLDSNVGPYNMFVIIFCIFTNLHLIYLVLMLVWLAFKVSIYRVVFEDKGKLSEVKQEETSVVSNSVSV